MVRFKMIGSILLTILLFISCKENTQSFAFQKEIKYKPTYDRDNSNYCFNEVQKIISTDIYKKNENNYFVISKEELLSNEFITKNFFFAQNILKFFDNTILVESYILKTQNKNYLILIGQSKGATGIGVNYWNYECYRLDELKSEIIKFSSLSKTPYSFYLNKNSAEEYITIDDNYPRPADGLEVDIDYYPVIGSLYSEKGNRIRKIEYNCK